MKKILKKNYIKIGVLGGTFDPPHIGHLSIAQIALKRFKLNKLLWLVTKKNPLKNKAFLTKKERIKLSKNITKKERKIFVKYFDDKIKPANTFNILSYIKKQNPSSKLFFLMGADNLRKFHKWDNWKLIPSLAKIVVFPREKYSIKSIKSKVLKKLSKKYFIFIKIKKINISSSLIRKYW